MDVELWSLPGPPNNNNHVLRDEEVTPGNGTCRNPNTAGDIENTHLLSDVQVQGSSGTCCVGDVTVDGASHKQSSMCGRKLSRMRKELNDEVCKLKLWMVILIVFIVIVVVIFLVVAVCAAPREDEDEKYDRSSFVVPRFFSGNFTVPNQNFTEGAHSPSLFLELQRKMADIYNSSFALKRYFDHAEINTLRYRGGWVEYKLKFLMPDEHHQLSRYTLSREVVYSVLLQQLLDQDVPDPLYILPASLSMQLASETDH